jgi:hypothetical protein
MLVLVVVEIRKFWKRERKKKEESAEPDIVINTEGEKLSAASVRKLRALAAGVAKKAMKVAEHVHPEDIFLLWLDEHKAFGPESAIVVPNEYLAAMYSLWTEGFVMHTYDDRVFATPSGRYVIKLLKMKLSGDKTWKQYI